MPRHKPADGPILGRHCVRDMALPVAFSLVMGTKSRDRLYGTSVRIAAKRSAEARREADKLARKAWTKRMLAFKGPAQPSPALGDALNASYTYLQVRCLGCDTHQAVALDIVRRPKSTRIHEPAARSGSCSGSMFKTIGATSR